MSDHHHHRSADSNPHVSADRGALLMTVIHLWPYIWPSDRRDLKLRVLGAMVLLLAAKLATVAVPFTFKWATDALAGHGTAPVAATDWLLWAIAAPVAMTIAYGGMRILMAALTQLRDGLFAKVAMHAVRRLAFRTFVHMHELSLRFHLERKTGGLTRVLERGRNAIETIVRMVILQLSPTIIELALIVGVLMWQFDWRYVAVVLVTVAVYMIYTYHATEWRIGIRRKMNESDTDANVKAIDSLLNYETVKYFSAEQREAERYDKSMARYEDASVQGLHLARRAQCRAGGDLHARACRRDGDVRLRNQGRHQDDRRFRADQRDDDPALPAAQFHGHGLSRDQAGGDRHRTDVLDSGARTGNQGRSRRAAAQGCERQYPLRERALRLRTGAAHSQGHQLRGAGRQNGGGGRPLRRRQVDDLAAAVPILRSGRRPHPDRRAGHRPRHAEARCARSIGMVPQDTVLFNDTIRYNIRYGRWEASNAEVEEAAKLAQIDRLIRMAPKGYETEVGERGLKLSGGEKQRVAIARTILKAPPILVLDEATSALDSHTEKEIQDALERVSKGRTTLVIAHRLSTIVGADEIIVLDQGEIVERGTHYALLAANGLYASMWNRQREAEEAREKLAQVGDNDVAPNRNPPLAGGHHFGGRRTAAGSAGRRGGVG